MGLSKASGAKIVIFTTGEIGYWVRFVTEGGGFTYKVQV